MDDELEIESTQICARVARAGRVEHHLLESAPVGDIDVLQFVNESLGIQDRFIEPVGHHRVPDEARHNQRCLRALNDHLEKLPERLPGVVEF